MKTIIAVPDFTRKAHLKKVLPLVLKRIKTPYKDVEIIIATGLHRAPTKKEIWENLGCIADKINLSVHNHEKKSVAYFGRTKNGTPVYLNKKIKKAASIITVGVVEPHLYAGYSGGTKVVSIGLAGEETINATHHPGFLDHPGTEICSIKGNTFREFIEDASKLLPVTYSINIVNNTKGDLLKIFEGDPITSFKKAVGFARKRFEKKLNKKFDAAICDIPRAKGVNIYQSSRAFNYIANTKNTIIKKGGLILVKADLEEGFGKGLGEKRFREQMLKMKGPEDLIKKIKKHGCLAGEHRAYMAAKAMLKARLGFISKNAHLYKNKTPFLFFKNLKEAKDYTKGKTYYLKNAFNTILIKSG